jgi:hypothetical protein
LSVESATIEPLGPALPVSETVPVVLPPLETVVGLSFNEAKVAAVSVIPAVEVDPFPVAEIVIEVWAFTAKVVKVNAALLLPDGTVTVAGTDTAAFGLVNDTTTPADPAFPFRVTVPIEGLPP